MADPVTLRDIATGDLERFYEHQTDAEATAMAAFVPRERAEFVEHWSRICADQTVYARTVLSGPEVAGYVVCYEQAGRWLVGYWIGRELWGRGVASSALARLLEAVPRRPLEAFVAKHNLASIRVLEKCGFRRVEERAAPASGGGKSDGRKGEEYLYRLDPPQPTRDPA